MIKRSLVFKIKLDGTMQETISRRADKNPNLHSINSRKITVLTNHGSWK